MKTYNRERHGANRLAENCRGARQELRPGSKYVAESLDVFSYRQICGHAAGRQCWRPARLLKPTVVRRRAHVGQVCNLPIPMILWQVTNLPHSFLRWLLVLVLMNVSLSESSATDNASNVLRPFLASHCLRCHGAEIQKADRRFDRLSLNANDGQSAELLQEVLDQLNLGAMPPEGETQPTAADVKRVVAFLTARLAEARESAKDNVGKVVIRRLVLLVSL